MNDRTSIVFVRPNHDRNGRTDDVKSQLLLHPKNKWQKIRHDILTSEISLRKTVNFQVFWPFQCLSKKLFTLHRHLFSQVQESLEKIRQTAFGRAIHRWACVRARFSQLLLAEIFVYIFQLCFRLLCRNSVFQCFSRKKKKWSRVFSEFLAMILAINWKFDTSAKF